MKDFIKARKRIEVSTGESVKMIRQLQGLSQNQLAEMTGIPQSTLSAIENDRINIGVRAGKSTGPCPEMSPSGPDVSRLGCGKRIIIQDLTTNLH